MYYTGYHGSPGPAFAVFDPARSGSQSGYEHARGIACFATAVEVAVSYAEGTGFVGEFGFHLEYPLDLDDAERMSGVGPLLAQARKNGHDGVILRNVKQDALTHGYRSDLIFLFDPTRARRLQILQEGPDAPTLPRRASGARR